MEGGDKDEKVMTDGCECENENDGDHEGGDVVRFEERNGQAQELLALGEIFRSEVKRPRFAKFVSWKDRNIRTKGRQLTSEHIRDDF